MKVVDVEQDKAWASLVKSASKERVVLRRGGKPSAILVSIESLDDEQLGLAGSADFWTMIESRRRKGSSIPLRELKTQLGLEAQAPKAKNKKR